MKARNILNIAVGAALTLGATACSSDYLDLKPEGVITQEEMAGEPEGLTLATRGLCQMMYKQYSALYDYNWFNGEPWLVMYYGEVMGQDYYSYFWALTGGTELLNWTSMDRRGQGSQVAWAYCYGIISQANSILSGIAGPSVWDATTELPDYEDGEVAFRRAQALTMRAHAYLRLYQIYGPRWQDRKNADGTEKLTVPLRLTFVEPEGDLSCPLATSSQVLDRIYADLDEAIRCYELSGMHRATTWEPDIEIAKGIYSRAALVKRDWAKAQTMAHEARQGYNLMTMAEYRQGFAAEHDSWLWASSGDAQGLYYASFGASYACNGAYPCLWGNIGAGAINWGLVQAASPYDYRTTLFFTPRYFASAGERQGFWSASNCNSGSMNINATSSGLHQNFVEFCQTRYDDYAASQGWYAPYTLQGYPVHTQTTTAVALFGAQFKFWGTDGYSSSQFPFMRAEELLLNEAEAAWHNGDEATASSLLDELNNLRYARWRNTYSGQDLLDQIKLSRRMELWGEGFNWFDFKRWREPIVRDEWVANDANSGNWPRAYAGTHDITESRGWRWRIPSTEYNYNTAIDQNEATSNDNYMSEEGEPD